MTTDPRTPTAIDAIAEHHVERLAALSPEFAAVTGLPGRRGTLDDRSPAGLQAHAALCRQTLNDLAAATAVDDVDQVTLAAMRERLGLTLEQSEAGEDLRHLDNIASPLQEIRDFFNLLPTDTEEDWGQAAHALADVPRALAGYQESLRLAASRGHVAARRQVGACIAQARNQADAGASSYSALVSGARGAGGAPLPTALVAELERSALAARQG